MIVPGMGKEKSTGEEIVVVSFTDVLQRNNCSITSILTEYYAIIKSESDKIFVIAVLCG